MSSLAQEESRSISENVTWGQRKRMADGKVSFAYSRFLGLDKDKQTGKIVVVPEEAETVRRMLSNKKYKGDALLRKEFTVDFLQKKLKKNEGEVPQYYVEGITSAALM